jgi:hypothetical protein
MTQHQDCGTRDRANRREARNTHIHIHTIFVVESTLEQHSIHHEGLRWCIASYKPAQSRQVAAATEHTNLHSQAHPPQQFCESAAMLAVL